eukprot:7807505-Pyramimonas_sp.AAC.1
MSGVGPLIQRGLSSYAAPWVRCGTTSAPAEVAPRHYGLSQARRGELAPQGHEQGAGGTELVDQPRQRC